MVSWLKKKRSRHTGPSCPREIINSTTCSFVSKDTSSMSLYRESAATIFASSVASLTWISWAMREQRMSWSKGKRSLSHRKWVTLLPNPLLLCLDRAMHFPACLILHTWSIINHTSSTPFNGLPHLQKKYMKIKHVNLWRKIMVSFIFMKQLMSTWGASESPTKWC